MVYGIPTNTHEHTCNLSNIIKGHSKCSKSLVNIENISKAELGNIKQHKVIIKVNDSLQLNIIKIMQ